MNFNCNSFSSRKNSSCPICNDRVTCTIERAVNKVLRSTTIIIRTCCLSCVLFRLPTVSPLNGIEYKLQIKSKKGEISLLDFTTLLRADELMLSRCVIHGLTNTAQYRMNWGNNWILQSCNYKLNRHLWRR